jgi:hypothetical protein
MEPNLQENQYLQPGALPDWTLWRPATSKSWHVRDSSLVEQPGGREGLLRLSGAQLLQQHPRDHSSARKQKFLAEDPGEDVTMPITKVAETR